MRTLGINGVGDSLYLALSVEGQIQDVEPYMVSEPAGLAADQRLVAVRNEIQRILKTQSVARVRVLDAEPQYKASYASLRVRIGLETIVLLACAEVGVDVGRLSRPRLKSLLGLTGPGGLSARAPEVTVPVGRSWAKKRDLASMAALAADKEN